MSAPTQLHGRWLMGIVVLVSSSALALPPALGAGRPLHPVLQVGVVDGAQPCSFREAGSWSGLAVEIWQRIADQEHLPYVLVPVANTGSLLQATARGQLDVAIGCLTVSPERMRQQRFTLPFQESGLGVMVQRSRLELGSSLLESLLTPDLMRLLLAYIAVIGLLSVGVWWVERDGSRPSGWDVGRRRAFALIFQVLATGPGTNTVVVSSRGHTIVFLAYLVRIITASLLVSYVTVNVVRGSQDLSNRNLRSPRDLAGLRVAVRPGSVSDDLLQELNRSGLEPPIQRRELKRITDADGLLSSGSVDAVLGDDIQLNYLLHRQANPRTALALRHLNPQSQAFALSPRLNADVASRINIALGRLKRDGVIARLRSQAVNKS